MKRLLALLALLLLASPAHARNWYTAAHGTGGGTSWGDSCSMATANAGVNEGDIVYLWQGTYTTAIDPNKGGTTANGKIYYEGGFGSDTAFVPNIVLTKNYVSVSNVTAATTSATYGATISAQHDSLDNVYMSHGVPHMTPTGDYYSIRNCTFVADSLHELAIGEGDQAGTLTGGEMVNTTITLYYTLSGRAAFHCDSTQSLTFTNCTFNITISPTSEGGMWKLYNSANGKWTDCTWNFTTYRQPTSEGNSSRLRNRSHDNRFLRCKWNWLASEHPIQFLISSTGNAGDDEAQRNNVFDYCEFRTAAPSQSPFPHWQAGMRRDSLAYCTVISAYATTFGINGVADSSTIVHNTFIHVAPDTLLGTGSPYYTTGTAHVIGGEDWTSKPDSVSDNIFYSVPVNADSLAGSAGAAWSTAAATITNLWGGNYNLWYGELGADSLIYIGGTPSDSTAVRALGVETNSKWGDPLFLGGTPSVATVLTFDAGLRTESPAIGKGTGGSDIGAIAASVTASDSFTVQYAAQTGGSIVGTAYQRVVYDSCATTVTARAAEHYTFEAWSDSDYDSTRTDCNVTADATYTANFLIDTVTVQYAAGANGSVSGAVYQRVAYGGDATTVTAVPATGYHFVRWLPDSLWTASRTDTTCQSDTTFTAQFGINTYTVTYTAGTGGTISGYTPQYVDYGSTAVNVDAIASTGYSLTGWSDGCAQIARESCAGGGDVITSDSTMTASFAINTYTLTYTALTGGSIVGTTPQTVNYNGYGSTVTATPSAGYGFYSWSDSLKSAARRDTLVTANKSVSAIFNTISSPAGTAGCTLTAATTRLTVPKVFTITSSGTAALHVYSITLYHRQGGTLRAMSCTKSSEAQTIAAGDSVTVTLTGITPRWRNLPNYRLVVLSDAGTDTLDWTYVPCP